MKVNMTPNPLDVVTIHASQGDSEARQWEFELHNNGELIDTSDVTEQMVFKAYKGGTEQILPENTSTPTTSPFLGDIRYPQGLLTDQEFTYRQSPTEEDGLAKITDIKGNTLVWNQLVQNGNFADTSLWRTYASTGFSVSNNVGSFTVTGATGAIYQTNTPTYVSGHKYLVIADFYVSQQSNISVEVSGTRGKVLSVNANTWYRYSDIVTPSAQGNFSLTCGQASVQVRNVMCFDLTAMGLDITDPSEFTSLFPLSYYSYNQGSLLSFNGNGIKTTGANLILFADETRTGTGITGTVSNGVFSASGTATSTYANLNYFNGIKVKNGEVYTVGLNKVLDCGITFRFATDTSDTVYQQATIPAGSQILKFTANNDYNYVRLYISGITSGTVVSFSGMIPMIANADLDAFEPYTSSTLSLPISTYFPSGMKSAGNVYDELTPTKAITRIGAIDLGSLTWNIQSPSGNFYADNVIADRKPSSNCQAICAIYNKANDVGGAGALTVDKAFAFQPNLVHRIIIRDTAYTTVEAFTNSLQGVYLYYELATPTETSFATASLVTENAEIPLSNNDGTLIGKCTEQLSENPGFFDAKIKLSDSDGECYSNKLQLHVERSPQ